MNRDLDRISLYKDHTCFCPKARSKTKVAMTQNAHNIYQWPQCPWIPTPPTKKTTRTSWDICVRSILVRYLSLHYSQWQNLSRKASHIYVFETLIETNESWWILRYDTANGPSKNCHQTYYQHLVSDNANPITSLFSHFCVLIQYIHIIIYNVDTR